MKKWMLIMFMACATAVSALAQGLPLMRNFPSSEYDAHNRNFDVICGENGMVFVANFEGLLYYDKAQWRILHTQGIHRLTRIFRDRNNRIWVGGYNYAGYVAADAAGRLMLKTVTADGSVPFRGQVENIWQDAEGHVCFQISNFSTFCAQGDKLVAVGAEPPQDETVDLGGGHEVNQVLMLDGGLRAVATAGAGVIVLDKDGQLLYHLDEESGLCNNAVKRIAYDGHGLLWGATDSGVFSVALPSLYSRFTAGENLKGEVLDIQQLQGVLFAATLNGLFRCMGQSFERVKGISYACWQLTPDGESLLAATTGGVYRVQADGTSKQLSTASSTEVLPMDGGFYSGELDGVFFYKDGFRSEVTDAEKVTHIYHDRSGNVWMQNLYGHIWLRQSGADSFQLVELDKQQDEVNTLVRYGNDMLCVNLSGAWRWDGRKMIPVADKLAAKISYPLFSYTDDEGFTWMTNEDGRKLHVMKGDADVPAYNKLITPLDDYVVRAVLRRQNQLWVGGDFGLIGIRAGMEDPILNTTPRLLLRHVVVQNDSVVWGGFGKQPQQLAPFSSDCRNIEIGFSLDYMPLLGDVNYRHRLNNGEWSAWSEKPHVRFFNMGYGSYTMDIQGRDAMGRLTEVVTLQFDVRPPFYLSWYMLLFYLLLGLALLYLLGRWRTHRLEQEKLRLENVVRERTAEVVKQKDEIVEKSQRLEQALDDLGHAQHELIRQEKMATVGKLTQGLIDRILNPMNYINNFSKLSAGLVNDVRLNIQDEQEHMAPENYDDTMDVLDMLTKNLEKVEQHGMNTSRTLKAMEEMLKDRSGGMVPMNLAAMLQKNYEMLNQYYQKEIAGCGIKTVFDCKPDNIQINGNAEQLSKTVMSLLGNAVYAVVKQSARATGYQPEVSMRISVDAADTVEVRIRDNGIGIEDTIIDKIFDPFFTTKTTGEASGVGLYLSHEIVQNHGGNITVTSQKDQFTEFVITIPMLHQ